MTTTAPGTTGVTTVGHDAPPTATPAAATADTTGERVDLDRAGARADRPGDGG